MEYSYKFRLYPNSEQRSLIARTFGCARFVYNHFLSLRKETYEASGETINYVKSSALLTQLKKELAWLKEVDSIPLQESLRDLESAYQGFFRRVKKGEKPGYPRFKSKHDRRKSYKTKQHVTNGKPTIYVDDSYIRLPKLGFVKCRVSKEVKGRILSATVSQSPSGKYFVALCCTDVEIEPLPPTGAVVGLDMGLKSFAITSDGVEYPNHKYLSKSQKKLARLQRQLSRKSKGSMRREKVPSAVGVQGGVVRQADSHGRPLLPVLPAVLCLWYTVVRDKGFVCPGVGLSRMRNRPQPGRERCKEHPK